MCEYALERFNPANAIGAHRGKAKNNYQKYLKPTLIKKGGEKKRKYKCTEYRTTEESNNGILRIKPTDNPKSGSIEIHANQIGNNGPWELIKREKIQQSWEITSKYNDPRELREREYITASHPEKSLEREIDTDMIASPDENTDDSEFRWGTSDRTIKRYLYIGEAIARADIIACTQEYPSTNFRKLLDEYENLSREERYTTLPIQTLRNYAEQKRSGYGRKYTDIPYQKRIEISMENLTEAFKDPNNHSEGPKTSKINEFIQDM